MAGHGRREEGGELSSKSLCHIIFLQLANIYSEFLFPPKEKKFYKKILKRIFEDWTLLFCIPSKPDNNSVSSSELLHSEKFGSHSKYSRYSSVFISKNNMKN